MEPNFEIRFLDEGDPEIISGAFKSIGWGKPVSRFQRYLAEQAAGSRMCLVATVNKQFAGYVTVNWTPTYAFFVEQESRNQNQNSTTEARSHGVTRRRRKVKKPKSKAKPYHK